MEPDWNTPVASPRVPFCNGLEPVNPEQRALVAGIRAFMDEEGDLVTGKKLTEMIQEVHLPGRLFHPNVLSTPEYYRQLRKLLERYHVKLPDPDDGKKLNSRRIARFLYSSAEYEEERILALRLIENYKQYDPLSDPARTASTPSAHGAVARESPDPYHRDRSSSDVYSNYRDDKTKYGGGISESWKDAKLKYESVCEAFQLTPQQKLLCFPAILKGAAARYFATDLKGKMSTYEEACSAIQTRFVSDAQQSRINNFLSGLRFDKFVGQDDNLNDALVKLIDTIERFFPQIPEAYHNEAYEIELLRRAVIGKSWARAAVAEINESVKTFPQFCHKLSVHLQNFVDEKELDTMGNSVCSDEKPTNEIFWQARYGNDLRKRQRNMFSSTTGALCWNCGAAGHRLRDCRKPRDHKKIAANMVAHYNKKKGMKPDNKQGYKKVLLTFAKEVNTFFATTDEAAMEESETRVRVLLGKCEENTHGEASSDDDEESTGSANDAEALHVWHSETQNADETEEDINRYNFLREQAVKFSASSAEPHDEEDFPFGDGI